MELIGIGNQSCGFVPTKCFLLGVDLFFGVDRVRRKKLLRFFAARSARTMIAPINLSHRFGLSFEGLGIFGGCQPFML